MSKRSVQVEIFAAGDGINYPQKVHERRKNVGALVSLCLRQSAGGSTTHREFRRAFSAPPVLAGNTPESPGLVRERAHFSSGEEKR